MEIKKTAKEATKIALDYFADLYPAKDYADLRLEEVDRHQEDWLITLGYTDKSNVTTMLSFAKRNFKEFKIDGQSGEVVSMKIRVME